MDTQTRGLDVVLNYKQFIGGGESSYNVGIAGNFNDLTIKNINNGDLNEYTFFGPFSQAYLEAAAPPFKIVLIGGYSTSKLDVNLQVTQFSGVELQDFQWVDSPATNKAEADALREVATDVYDPALSVDLSVGYDITKNLRLTLGANNLLNTYPTPQFDGWTDQGGFNDSVQMGADGAYFFGRLGIRF